MDWRIALIILGVFAVAYLLTQYVSLASVLAALAFSVSFAVLHFGDWVVMSCGIVMGGMAVYMHRSNIQRLIRGEESKTNLFKK